LAERLSEVELQPPRLLAVQMHHACRSKLPLLLLLLLLLMLSALH
jgi:hypothetical protein